MAASGTPGQVTGLVAEVGACQGCGACLLTCPEHAFRPLGSRLLVVEERCSGCGECVEVCPVDAIELVERGSGR
ncbi:indolepyruvate ferredoxin oxidoreductase subunit alpha [Actinocrinis sp.]|uniref:indolepyruvate ferredoxin oxidoreductase subunit alpha n=1 Tax=Actinocrinis sp. TaxID=1920516 RepID=UPI0032C22FB2